MANGENNSEFHDGLTRSRYWDCVLLSYLACFSWGQKKAQVCVKWVEEFTPICIQTGSEQKEKCVSWLPGWLEWVCFLWVLITIIVCVAFAMIATLVCYLVAIVWLVICLVWFIILLFYCAFSS